MTNQTILDCIKELEPLYRDFWRSMVRMESPSEERAAVNRLADYIAGFAGERGFAVERKSFPCAGDMLVIRLAGAADLAPVAAIAHMDTVHPLGSFGPDPLREENGVLYGPGVFDCKGGIASALLGMEALGRCGQRHRPVALLLNSDEENGRFVGEEGERFMRDTFAGCAAAFNCESGREGSITVGRKGAARVTVTVRGKAAHAGNDYFEGVSAIREAAHKIIDIEACSRTDGVTLNCGLIQGGTAANAVPDGCQFQVDIRFLNGEQEKWAMERLGEIVARSYVPGSESAMTLTTRRPAMEPTAANYLLGELIAAAARDLGLGELELMIRGGASDSAYAVEMGVPTVCSLGTVGRYEHTPREEADIATLGPRAALLAESILRV